jgi:hypothetical protein
MKVSTAVLSFAAAVAAHGDHGHDQESLAGPHQGLWYNNLPGDGGTQVGVLGSEFFYRTATDQLVGGFCLLWHFHVWPSSLQSVLVHSRQIRHRVYW